MINLRSWDWWFKHHQRYSYCVVCFVYPLLEHETALSMNITSRCHDTKMSNLTHRHIGERRWRWVWYVTTFARNEYWNFVLKRLVYFQPTLAECWKMARSFKKAYTCWFQHVCSIYRLLCMRASQAITRTQNICRLRQLLNINLIKKIHNRASLAIT